MGAVNNQQQGCRMKQQQLSSSSGGTFLTCPERYRISVVEGLEPRVKGVALSFGTLVHRCLDSVYSNMMGRPVVDGRSVIGGAELVTASLVMTHDVVNAWLGERGQQIDKRYGNSNDPADIQAGEEAQVKAEEIAGKAVRVLERYIKKNLASDQDRYEILAVEHPIRIPVVTPSGYASSLWHYVCKVDGLVRDRQDGRVLLLEHKTTSSRQRPQFESELKYATQPRAYMYAANYLRGKVHPLAASLEGGVHGVLYNVLCSKEPSMPAALKSPAGHMTRRRCDTTPDIYKAQFEQLQAAIENPGARMVWETYREEYERLAARGDSFMFRHELYVSEQQQAEAMADLWQCSRLISQSMQMKQERWARNRSACNTPSRVCPFRAACFLDASEDQALYVKREGGQIGAPEIEAGAFKK